MSFASLRRVFLASLVLALAVYASAGLLVSFAKSADEGVAVTAAANGNSKGNGNGNSNGNPGKSNGNPGNSNSNSNGNSNGNSSPASASQSESSASPAPGNSAPKNRGQAAKASKSNGNPGNSHPGNSHPGNSHPGNSQGNNPSNGNPNVTPAQAGNSPAQATNPGNGKAKGQASKGNKSQAKGNNGQAKGNNGQAKGKPAHAGQKGKPAHAGQKGKPAHAGNNGRKDHKVGVCHATGSAKNPYVYIEVAEQAVTKGGHGKHAHDVIGVSGPADCPSVAGTTPQTPQTPVSPQTPPVAFDKVGVCRAVNGGWTYTQVLVTEVLSGDILGVSGPGDCPATPPTTPVDDTDVLDRDDERPGQTEVRDRAGTRADRSARPVAAATGTQPQLARTGMSLGLQAALAMAALLAGALLVARSRKRSVMTGR